MAYMTAHESVHYSKGGDNQRRKKGQADPRDVIMPTSHSYTTWREGGAKKHIDAPKGRQVD